MITLRGARKVDRVTVTLLPTAKDRNFRVVPSTFSAVNRSYEWHKSNTVNYMIVPKRITNAKIELDVFVDPVRKGKMQAKSLLKVVQNFITGKIDSEWRGLKLGGIGRPTAALPPQKLLIRGSIEDILGIPIKE